MQLENSSPPPGRGKTGLDPPSLGPREQAGVQHGAQGQPYPYLGCPYHSWVRVSTAAPGTGTRWPCTAPAALGPAASAGEESSSRWVSQSTESLITSFFQPVSCKGTIKRSSLGVTHGVGTPKAAPSGSGG